MPVGNWQLKCNTYECYIILPCWFLSIFTSLPLKIHNSRKANKKLHKIKYILLNFENSFTLYISRLRGCLVLNVNIFIFYYSLLVSYIRLSNFQSILLCNGKWIGLSPSIVQYWCSSGLCFVTNTWFHINFKFNTFIR